MKLLKHTGIYFFGEILAGALPFFMIPYIASRIGVDAYGELSYFQTYAGLILLVVSMSQASALARYYYRYGSRSLDLMINTGYLWAGGVSVVAFFISYLFGSYIMMIIIVTNLLSLFIQIQLMIRQCQRDPFNYTKIQIIAGLTMVAFNVLFLELFKKSIETYLISALVADIITLVWSYLAYRNKHKKTKSFTTKHYLLALTYLLSFGGPLLISGFTSFFKGPFDRILIYNTYSAKDLAVYAVGTQMALLWAIFVSAINKVASPYIFERLRNKSIGVREIYRYSLLAFLFIPCGALFYLLIPEYMLLWIMGDDFAGIKYFAVIFSIAYLLALPKISLGLYLTYYRKMRYLVALELFSTTLYVVLLALLINGGLKLIPMATIVSQIAILPIEYIIVYRVSQQVKR